MKNKWLYSLMYIVTIVFFIISMISMIKLGALIGSETHTIADSFETERTEKDNQIIFAEKIYMIFVIIDIIIVVLLENVIYSKNKEAIMKNAQEYEGDKKILFKKAKNQINGYRAVTIILILIFLMLSVVITV